MKVIASKIDGDRKTILVVEHGIFKTRTEYLAKEKIIEDFYTWVKLPNKTIVPDRLSFQLDEWKKDFD